MMLFTSGSTGHPKGVVLSHANLAWNAAGVIERTGLTSEDRLIHVMPLHHTNGVNNQLLAPFLAGATVVLIDKFRPENVALQILTHSPTYMTGVPTVFARVLPNLSAAHRFPSLRFLRCGSAPIDASLHRAIESAFGVPLIVSYGLSEATCTSAMNPPDARRIGSVGKALAGQQVDLIAIGSDTPVPQGSEGEVCIAGPTLMKGYLPESERSPIVNGRLRTGDLGRFDPDGYLTITGRIKDVIMRGGENLSPQLIESIVMSHPAIAACCVVGAPDADLGEVPVAFVVVRPDHKVAAESLRTWVSDRLSRIYAPSQVRFVDSLPEIGVGKVDRKRLRMKLVNPDQRPVE